MEAGILSGAGFFPFLLATFTYPFCHLLPSALPLMPSVISSLLTHIRTFSVMAICI
ncbi:MAG: hypothetical protein ACD_75C00536G0003 [uncultured bacterium]|nr:MAG: hypothetical protein ACD_75C00536G0003 [uncultured bacterium]